MSTPCLVLTSCGSEPTAIAMARHLVDRGLAASASLVPLRTVFRYDGQTLEEEEIQLQVITAVERYPEVEAAILRLHTYELPDVVMLRTQACAEATRIWLETVLPHRPETRP